MRKLLFTISALLMFASACSEKNEDVPVSARKGLEELPVTLQAPGGVSAADESSDSRVRFSWNEVPGATGYIWVLEDMKRETLASGSSSATHCTPEKLAKGRRYFLKVMAVGEESRSEYSQYAEGVPGGVPDLLFVASVSSSETFKWVSSDDVLVSDGTNAAVYVPAETGSEKTILVPKAGEPELAASGQFHFSYPASYGLEGVPANQRHVAGLTGKEPCEAVLSGDGYNVELQPVCGYVSFEIKASEVPVTAVKLTALGGEEISAAGSSVTLLPSGADTLVAGKYTVFVKPASFSKGVKYTLNHRSDTKTASVVSEAAFGLSRGETASPVASFDPSQLLWAGLSLQLLSDGDLLTAECDNGDADLFYEYSYESLDAVAEPALSSPRFPVGGIVLEKTIYVKVLCVCEDYEDVRDEIVAVPLVNYGTVWNVFDEFGNESGFFWDMFKKFGVDEILSGELSSHKMTFAIGEPRAGRASKCMSSGAYFHFDKAYLKFNVAVSGIGKVTVNGCGSSKTSVRTLTFYINGDKATAKTLDMPLSTAIGDVSLTLDVETGDEVSFTSNNPVYVYSLTWSE